MRRCSALHASLDGPGSTKPRARKANGSHAHEPTATATASQVSPLTPATTNPTNSTSLAAASASKIAE